MYATGLFARLSILVCLVALSSGVAFADTYTFEDLPPGGNIAGPPGSTIGWGYSITNDSTTDWLVTVNLTSAPFTDGTADASPFDFPIVSPSSTVTLPYDQATNTGLFALTWDTTAPVGFTNAGVFTLSAEWWSGDPLTTGMFLMDAPDETAAYSATVSGTVVSAREPGSAWLLLAGISMSILALLRSRRCNLSRITVA
jgi:hypothetical protein